MLLLPANGPNDRHTILQLFFQHGCLLNDGTARVDCAGRSVDHSNRGSDISLADFASDVFSGVRSVVGSSSIEWILRVAYPGSVERRWYWW